MSVRRRGLVLAAVAVFGLANPALAQVRRIQGKVADHQGAPVADALIEARVGALADADFAVRNNDQVFRARTNASGDYIITVTVARSYVVTATKQGVGTDQVTVRVQQSGLTTANLTLSKPATSPAASPMCDTPTPLESFKPKWLTGGAEPGLVRFFRWLDAVRLHVPGCADRLLADISGWSRRDLEVLLRDVTELAKFLERVNSERAAFEGRSSASRDRLTFSVYDRRLTVDQLEQFFFNDHSIRANSLLLRGAVLHADVAVFAPGDVGRYPLVDDGGGRGWRSGSSHWEVGRLLLDYITPDASADALLWYRASSAHLFRTGNLAELPSHLLRARDVFPQSSEVLFDSARLHQELSSPAIQASAQQLRANDVTVSVGSRTSELQRTERFLRETLALVPDDAEARLRLGHTLVELGRYQDAAVELRRAVEAKADTRHVYLAELFLGRAEEALGRHAEARRHYDRAAELYPRAQSPLLALSRLAQQTGEPAAARRFVQSLTALYDAEAPDPWWEFYQAHQDDADLLMARMRTLGN